jgi:transcriptional regulator with GAF, ATPase, and Fis domain
VVTLVDTLLDDYDVVDLLTQLTESCTQVLDVHAAGLLLADPLGELHLMAATSEKARDLELFQLQAEEGPCLDCYTTGRPVSVADLRAAPHRWPRFTDAASQAGFASVHALPMRAGGTVLGAMGLFGSRTGEMNEADQLVGQTLTHIACVAILQERSPSAATILPHLHRALERRVLVEQAKGFLRERLDIPVETAFILLRQYGRVHGEHMSDVARRLIGQSAERPAILDAMRRLLTREVG